MILHEKINENAIRYQELNILVIGDVMLDSYLWGEAERISPEAPVPIVNVRSSSSNPGGAGNVVSNLSLIHI